MNKNRIEKRMNLTNLRAGDACVILFSKIQILNRQNLRSIYHWYIEELIQREQEEISSEYSMRIFHRLSAILNIYNTSDIQSMMKTGIKGRYKGRFFSVDNKTQSGKSIQYRQKS